MAEADYIRPIAGLHGKLKKDSNVSFRGKHTYCLQHPRTEKDFSEHEKAYRKSFGEMNKEASRINKDESRMSEYQDWQEKGYKSRFRYILATLVKEQTLP